MVETGVSLPSWKWGQFMEGQARYFSYLLRVWLAGDSDQPHWRASLEDTHSGERIGFASLEAMWKYLKQQVGVQSEKSIGPGKEGI